MPECIPCLRGKRHFWHDQGARTNTTVPTTAARFPPSLLPTAYERYKAERLADPEFRALYEQSRREWAEVIGDYYTPNNTGIPIA